MLAPTKFSAALIFISDSLRLAAYGCGAAAVFGWLRENTTTMPTTTTTRASPIRIARQFDSRSSLAGDGWIKPPMAELYIPHVARDGDTRARSGSAVELKVTLRQPS